MPNLYSHIYDTKMLYPADTWRGYNVGKPRDAKQRSFWRFFYPTLTLMIDSYNK